MLAEKADTTVTLPAAAEMAGFDTLEVETRGTDFHHARLSRLSRAGAECLVAGNAEKRVPEAIAEFREVVRLDPLDAGAHTLILTITVPPGIKVVTISPAGIVVTVTVPPSPSPSPSPLPSV